MVKTLEDVRLQARTHARVRFLLMEFCHDPTGAAAAAYVNHVTHEFR